MQVTDISSSWFPVQLKLRAANSHSSLAALNAQWSMHQKFTGTVSIVEYTTLEETAISIATTYGIVTLQGLSSPKAMVLMLN